MAKIEDRKVNITKLRSRWRSTGYFYFNLTVGNYKYILTDTRELMTFSDYKKQPYKFKKEGKQPLYPALYTRYGNTPTYYTFQIKYEDVMKLQEACVDKQKAILYAKEDGLDAFCHVKVKYFPDKEIHLKGFPEVYLAWINKQNGKN
jgi:hypothetical protein